VIEAGCSKGAAFTRALAKVVRRSVTCRNGHVHPRQRSERSLKLAFWITAGWFVLELLAGFYTNSLALLADAAHMLVDLAALMLSLFALKISALPATHQKTYGYLRAEILAALANGIFLVVVSAYICYEAFHRIVAPPQVKSLPMLAVAASGLLANLATAALLYGSQHESLNIRGAFLHVMSDTLGSIGAIGAGAAMLIWKWYLADPIVSILVSVLVLVSSWGLVRESVDVLLEGAPRNVRIPDILADLGGFEGVLSVHDLHVWSITSGLPAMSCHVVLRRGMDARAVLSVLSRLMREKYSIEHTTIQIEEESLVVPRSNL
jgi:cobalt-zinc-cadmium efflux system protein